MSTATRPRVTSRNAVAYRVRLFDTWGNARDGWEVNDVHNGPVIRLPYGGGVRAMIRAMREAGLVWDSRRMMPLGEAMSSSPYMGGHIDLCQRDGKPVGQLERLEMDPETLLRRAGVRVTSYALAVASGEAALSGSDLKGKAAKYGGKYARTRVAVVRALQAGGWIVVRELGGRLALRERVPDGAMVGKPCAVSREVWDLRRETVAHRHGLTT